MKSNNHKGKESNSYVNSDDKSDRISSQADSNQYDDSEREGSWTDWAESQYYSDDYGNVSLPETCWWE